MDSQRIVELLRNPTSVSDQEIEEISLLVKDYPYSAFLKIISAKIAHVGRLKDANTKITSAAIATADRINLKNYINSDQWYEPVKPEIKEEIQEDAGPATVQPSKKDQIAAEPTDIKPEQDKISPEPAKNEEKLMEVKDTDSETLATDLIKNIDEYRRQRKIFSNLMDEKLGSKKTAGGNKKSGTAKKEKDMDRKEDEPGESSSKDMGAKKAKSATAKTGMKAKKSTTRKVRSKSGKKDTAQRKKKPSEDILPETGMKQELPDIHSIRKVTEEKKSEGLKVNEAEDPEVIREYLDQIADAEETGKKKDLKDQKKENKPQTSKIKKLKKEEQKDIIEKFINTEPKIKNIKSADSENKREDLSLPSIKFKDDIISENLALIMIKQGKLEKAIDIYKKLIWKFPQKKAYFASHIEELKQKLGK